MIITYKNPRILYGTTDITFSANDFKVERLEQERSEHIFEDQNSNKSIYKKGNRNIWEFAIYQIRQTDDAFNTLIDQLKTGNGYIVKFYPNTVDKANTYYNAYMVSYPDKYSESPVWKIMFKMTELDLNEPKTD